jgi:hypothetical protein
MAGELWYAVASPPARSSSRAGLESIGRFAANLKTGSAGNSSASDEGSTSTAGQPTMYSRMRAKRLQETS